MGSFVHGLRVCILCWGQINGAERTSCFSVLDIWRFYPRRLAIVRVCGSPPSPPLRWIDWLMKRNSTLKTDTCKRKANRLGSEVIGGCSVVVSEVSATLLKLSLGRHTSVPPPTPRPPAPCTGYRQPKRLSSRRFLVEINERVPMKPPESASIFRVMLQ